MAPDSATYLEQALKQRFPAVTVFQNPADGDNVELHIQNVPGRDLQLIRILLTRSSAQAVAANPTTVQRLLATVDQALSQPSDAPEAILDLRRSP